MERELPVVTLFVVLAIGAYVVGKVIFTFAGPDLESVSIPSLHAYQAPPLSGSRRPFGVPWDSNRRNTKILQASALNLRASELLLEQARFHGPQSDSYLELLSASAESGDTAALRELLEYILWTRESASQATRYEDVKEAYRKLSVVEEIWGVRNYESELAHLIKAVVISAHTSDGSFNEFFTELQRQNSEKKEPYDYWILAEMWSLNYLEKQPGFDEMRPSHFEEVLRQLVMRGGGSIKEWVSAVNWVNDRIEGKGPCVFRKKFHKI